MRCERVGNAIVCGGRRKRSAANCSLCHWRPAVVLCDGPEASTRKTCDAPMCKECASHVDPDRDYCPRHNAPEKRRLAL